MSDVNKYPAAYKSEINKVLDPYNEAELLALTANFKGDEQATQLFVSLLKNFEDYYLIPEPYQSSNGHLPYPLRASDEYKFKNRTPAPGYMLRGDQVEGLKTEYDNFDVLFESLGKSKLVKTFNGLDYHDGVCDRDCKVWTIDWHIFVDLIDEAKADQSFNVNIGKTITRKCGIEKMERRKSPPCNLIIKDAPEVGVKEVRLSGKVANHHLKGNATKYAGWKWDTAIIEFTGLVEQDNQCTAFVIIEDPAYFELISIDD